MPEIHHKMEDLGIMLLPGTPAAFTAFVKDQVAQLAPVVKNAGVKLQPRNLSGD